LGILNATEVEFHQRLFEEKYADVAPLRSVPPDYRHISPLIESIERMTRRFLRVPTRLSNARVWAHEFSLRHDISVRIGGGSGFSLGLSVDQPLARRLVSQLAGSDGTECEIGRALTLWIEFVVEHCRRLQGELNGTVKSELGSSAASEFDGAVEATTIVEPPQYGRLPRAGIVFDLLAGEGRALIVLGRESALRTPASP
jgi:hypothetical protein